MKHLSEAPAPILDAIIEALEAKHRPPVVDTIASLATEEGRLRLAELKGAHEVVLGLKAARRQQERP